MPVRDTDVGAFVAGISPLSAATSNSGAGGKIARAIRNTDSAGTTTVETPLTIAGVPVNVGREIEIIVQGLLRTNIPSHVQVRIQEDGVDLCRYDFWSPGASSAPAGGKSVPFHFAIGSRPTSGTHTYTLITGVAGGSGATCTLIADASGPARLNVYDFGAAIF